MTTTIASRLPAASADQIEFVRGISNPTPVLEAISRGHDVINRLGEFASPIELAAAVSGTWLEIAELEGDITADRICDSIWPLGGDADAMPLAAAA